MSNSSNTRAHQIVKCGQVMIGAGRSIEHVCRIYHITPEKWSELVAWYQAGAWASAVGGPPPEIDPKKV